MDEWLLEIFAHNSVKLLLKILTKSLIRAMMFYMTILENFVKLGQTFIHICLVKAFGWSQEGNKDVSLLPSQTVASLSCPHPTTICLGHGPEMTTDYHFQVVPRSRPAH